MTRVVIGFDTSCYTTSVAAVTVEGQVIASCRKLLPVKLGERGLRQSEGVWHHVRALPERLEELAPHIRDCEIAAVCVSARPRDEADSYMPVFHAGDAQGRSLAAMLGVPCFSTTHQRGHIAAAKVDSGIVDGDLLAVHLSGGTTELLSLVGDELTLLGGALDLHAGQVVDRTGVAMGLPFPAGPHLEKLAVQGRSEARLTMTTRDGGLNCHFSGAEKTGIGQVLIAGGVSSSKLFRELVTERIHKRDRELRVCFGKPEYSGDNAVGTALIGAQMLRENEE